MPEAFSECLGGRQVVVGKTALLDQRHQQRRRDQRQNRDPFSHDHPGRHHDLRVLRLLPCTHRGDQAHTKIQTARDRHEDRDKNQQPPAGAYSVRSRKKIAHGRARTLRRGYLCRVHVKVRCINVWSHLSSPRVLTTIRGRGRVSFTLGELSRTPADVDVSRAISGAKRPRRQCPAFLYRGIASKFAIAGGSGCRKPASKGKKMKKEENANAGS